MDKFFWKLHYFGASIGFIFKLVPIRFGRLVNHLARGGANFKKSLALKFELPAATYKVANWWIELFFFLVDLVGIPDVYDAVGNLIKPNVRPLGQTEQKTARSVFGAALNYTRIAVDERAYIGCKNWNFCYVSFFTVNAWGKMPPELLVHELMHVWQFQHLGAVYIPRALSAQNTREGYDYGGIEGLEAAIKKGYSILDFNYEQQAEIVSDYYCIKEGKLPRWGDGNPGDLELYLYFMSEVRNPRKV